MDTTTAQEMAFAAGLEQELAAQTDLRMLDDWYSAQLKALQTQPNAERMTTLLEKLYRRAVARLIGRAADELVDSNSGAHKEVLDRFDAAWRELANR